MLEKIAEKMLLWQMDARLLGTAALLWCAHDAARLTLNGEPWTLKQLYMNFVDKRESSWASVGLAIEDALAAAGVHLSNKRAICALVGYALQGRISINTPEGWNALAEKDGVTSEG